MSAYNKYIKAIVEYKFLSLYLLMILTSISLLAHENPQHKINDLNHQISHHPKNVKYLMQRAEKYQSVGNWKKALKDYEHIKYLSPKYKNLTYLLGLSYYGDKQFNKAKRQFDTLLKTFPKNVKALTMRARILHDLKQCKASYHDYTRAILDSTEKTILYIERAKNTKECDSSLLNRAIVDLDDAMHSMGHLVIFEQVMIDLALKKKDYTKALKSVDSILSQVKRKEKWYVQRAKILDLLGKPKKAFKAYAHAIKAIKILPLHIRKTTAMQKLLMEIESDIKNIPLKS